MFGATPADAVKLVAVKHQQFATVGSLVNRFRQQLDAAEVQTHIVTEDFVVIARHIDDAGAVLGLLEHTAHHVVVSRRPVPAFAQLPAVDDVADEVERLAFCRLQEVEQHLSLAARCPQMRVGYPDRAIGEGGPGAFEMYGFFNPGRRSRNPGNRQSCVSCHSHLPSAWSV